ncbi:multiple inositol polyphosphate phosphatase 1b isoform X2 [Chiloscyllium plagiosum]|uniref:multiple inositol polyphosphate phosphatase 1b isoform X2 n=2 Tax=Chiloscyllium plagiosum TaxID=36176 RepID=UPI001CB86D81|nr:multiple inositol polyphosphate phosphatase 1b isoform X2 [Chiloscyllium plagiosum]
MLCMSGAAPGAGAGSPGSLLLLLWLSIRLCSASSGRLPWAEHYGTKSRYEGLSVEPLPGTSRLAPANCTALQLNALVRHGTRYPTRKNVPRMREVHQLIKEQGDPGNSLVQALADWHMWYNERMDGNLHPLGTAEMVRLAKRLAAQFPTLFTARCYRESRLKFVTSSKHRCVNSTRSFIQGVESHLSLRDQAGGQWEVNDRLLRFFDHCQKFINRVENNNTALHQVELFKRGPEMERVMRNMGKKLGISPEALTTNMVEATFYLCTYEFILKGIVSPWCDVFEKEDVEVLEYLGDLKQYWKRSYGYKINGLSSYKLFQDLFHYMDQTIEESERNQSISHTAVIRFGHAETLLPVLTLMGYFKDKYPLQANNFEAQRGRKFRSGWISPFAANLVLVLYRCNEARGLGEKYKLQLFLNEKPLPFAHSGNLVTDYEEVKYSYEHLTESLKFNNVCDDHRYFHFILFLFLLLLFLIYY